MLKFQFSNSFNNFTWLVYYYTIILFFALGLPNVVHSADSDWPVKGKPVRVVVPFPPGLGTDILMRQIARKISDQTGIAVVIDNKPGAGTVIGAQEVSRAKADGHTLLYTIVVTHTQNPHLYDKLPYDPFKDFTPIIQIVRSATVLVVKKDAPFNSVRDLINAAKNHSVGMNFASYSAGSTSHLNGEILRIKSGTKMIHVPYKGTSDASRALIAGDVDFYFDGTASAIQGHKSGIYKLLGVASDKRLALLPELPTIVEQGIDGLDIVGWQGVFGPADMDKEVVKKISNAFLNALRSTEISNLISLQGNEVSGLGPKEFSTIVRHDYERWGKIIKDLGLVLN